MALPSTFTFKDVCFELCSGLLWLNIDCFTHIHQGCFIVSGAIVRFPIPIKRPVEHGLICNINAPKSDDIATTKHTTTNLRTYFMALLWRNNGRGSVSNHQLHDCLLNRLFRRRLKKTSKLRVTGLCALKMFPFDDDIMGCAVFIQNVIPCGSLLPVQIIHTANTRLSRKCS